MEESNVIKKTNGQYNTKVKPFRFISIKNNLKFSSNVALLDGKYFSSEDLKDMTFKFEILDDKTFNFDEVENRVNRERLDLLVDILINEDTFYAIDQQLIIRKFKFHSEDDKYNFYLTVEKETPYSKLKRVVFSEDKTTENIEKVNNISKSKLSKLKDLFGGNDVDVVDNNIETHNNTDVETTITYNNETNSDSVNNSMNSLKDNLLKELNNKRENILKELSNKNREFAIIKSEINNKEKDLNILNDRIDNLTIVNPNGFSFKVSEVINEDISILDEDVENIIKSKLSRLQNINVEALIKYLKSREFEILFFDNDGKTSELNDDLKKELEKLNINRVENTFKYVGDLSWHDINNKLLKLGYSEFK